MNNDRLDKFSPESTGHSPKPSALQPIYYAATLIGGLLIGTFLADRNLLTIKTGTEENPNKLVSLIDYIEDNYVDSVDKRKLIDDAIGSILMNLDPHSYYLSPEELARAQEELEGGFEGIGVEFLILRDSLMVVKTIPGGPSEKAGLKAGDRIVRVNGEDITGKELNSEKAQKLLKGDRGSDVKVEVDRAGEKELLSMTITRGNIPLESVPASFMVDEEVGYVKVERFAKTTYREFMDATEALQQEGCKTLILDLRGNGGGLMDQATRMVEEFLDKDMLIVYTEGAHSGKEVTKSSKRGAFLEMNVVVLLDQGSASASEIVAGALQDWDRSVTVGRRSFGKGLVQHEIELPDNSALRLTVARYYTPSGRCIQKPYGDSIDYGSDFHDRIASGELLNRDSIHVADSLVYFTEGGRKVFGGGGIVPDVFVPIDTAHLSGLLGELVYSGVMREYCFNYTDTNRARFAKYKDVDEFIDEFTVTEAMLVAIMKEADEEGIEASQREVRRIAPELRRRIKAQIARNLYDETAMYRVLMEGDNDLQQAIEVARDYQKFALVPAQ